MTDRIGFALDRGALEWPVSSRAIAFGVAGRPRPDWLDAERFTVVQGFAPDARLLDVAGFKVMPEFGASDEAFDLAVVELPRERLRAQMWIAQAVSALKPDGLLVVNGAKTDGVDTIWRTCKARLLDPESETKFHGRTFWGRPSGSFADWIEQALALPPVDGMKVAPGVFSADGVDPGSAALAAVLPEKLPARVADLGAGWGWLSRQMLARKGVTHLDLVEADHAALEAARENITDPRASFHWADATNWRSSEPLDAVIMNPPFHAGRAGDPSIGQAFIESAARSLSPRGQLWLVANRHLPYEAHLKDLFGDISELPGPSAFKILHAARPRKARR